MWFKNIRIYRFNQDFSITPEALNDALKEQSFVPCNSQDQERMGWVNPITGLADTADNESYVHASQGYMMICAKRQEKVLPAAVINEFLLEKVEAIQDAEGRKVSRKERQDLRDEVMMDLLPKAFTRSQLQYAYIAPEQGYMVIDAASASKAEALLSVLRESITRLPLVPLTSKQMPVDVMTHWLNESTLHGAFALGDTCELSDPQEPGSVIRCKQQDLESDEVSTLLKSGMLVTKLNVAWLSGISFMLDDQCAIKRLRFEDNILEKADHDAESKAEQFDIDFAVMTLELTALIKDLVTALGGMNMDAPSVDEIVAKALRDEPADSTVKEVEMA